MMMPKFELFESLSDLWVAYAVRFVKNNYTLEEIKDFREDKRDYIEILDAIYEDKSFDAPILTLEDLKNECKKAIDDGLYDYVILRAYVLSEYTKSPIYVKYWAYNVNPVGITKSMVLQIVDKAYHDLQGE